jgi:hypothetical protein
MSQLSASLPKISYFHVAGTVLGIKVREIIRQIAITAVPQMPAIRAKLLDFPRIQADVVPGGKAAIQRSRWIGRRD